MGGMRMQVAAMDAPTVTNTVLGILAQGVVGALRRAHHATPCPVAADTAHGGPPGQPDTDTSGVT